MSICNIRHNFLKSLHFIYLPSFVPVCLPSYKNTKLSSSFPTFIIYYYNRVWMLMFITYENHFHLDFLCSTCSWLHVTVRKHKLTPRRLIDLKRPPELVLKTCSIACFWTGGRYWSWQHPQIDELRSMNRSM